MPTRTCPSRPWASFQRVHDGVSYDDAGGKLTQLDSPQYKEYMASPWKDMWTQAMIKEVDKCVLAWDPKHPDIIINHFKSSQS